jgi:hypothetical protein
MSKIALTPNASGTGTFTIASPNSNTDRTLTLPDAAGEILTTAGGTLTGALTGTDLTLSGGVYLGGTGAANYLDDYEEGTFTPTLVGSTAAGTATYLSQDGNYTKVGNQVTAYVNLKVSALSGATGQLRFESLPFTSASGSFATGSIMIDGLNWDSGTYAVVYVGASQSYCRIFLMADDSSWTVQSPTNEAQEYYFTITYQVTS